jgi:hypothetical protein
MINGAQFDRREFSLDRLRRAFDWFVLNNPFFLSAARVFPTLNEWLTGREDSLLPTLESLHAQLLSSSESQGVDPASVGEGLVFPVDEIDSRTHARDSALQGIPAGDEVIPGDARKVMWRDRLLESKVFPFLFPLAQGGYYDDR